MKDLTDSELPTVTIVISAYNEEAVIPEKRRNLSQIDYPFHKLEILFGSDGSSDGTCSRLREELPANVRVVEFQERRGKAAVLNDLIPQATGEVVVLSDANTLYNENTLRKLVVHFEDPKVGAVCGELVLKANEMTAGGLGEASYWTYENRIKLMESTIGTTVGATGAVYAIRKQLFRSIPTTKTVTDDFLISIDILKQGFSMRYAFDAIAYERSTNSVMGEFHRKVRIGAANFHGIPELLPLLSPKQGFAAFVLWSRKIIRWFVPFLLIGMIMTSLLLAGESSYFMIVVLLEAVFAMLVIVGFILERLDVNAGVIGLPYYFAAMNAALLLGFFRFLFRMQLPTWRVIR